MTNNELWKAIVDLYGSINGRENRESAYQAFFENHPVVFSELGYDAALSFEKSSPHKLPHDGEKNYRPEPDFICGVRRTGVVTVFELKTPFQEGATTKRSDGNREKFRASVETHISQAQEYVESIRGREAARSVVCKALNLSKISSYDVVAVYGLSDANDATSVARLTSERKTPTEILPYDVLLDRLVVSFTRSRKDFDPQSGLSLFCEIVIAEDQVNTRAYVLDLGSPDRDRISMYVEAGVLILECVDSHGESHRFPCSVSLNKMHYVVFQVSSSVQGIWITCSIDDEELNLRQGQERLKIEPDLKFFKLGCNLNDKEHGRFLTGSIGYRNKTLGIKERLDMSIWFKNRDRGAQYCLEFDGSKSMHVDGCGSLIAPTDEARPILRDYIAFPDANAC